jgi:hypothetical protein
MESLLFLRIREFIPFGKPYNHSILGYMPIAAPLDSYAPARYRLAHIREYQTRRTGECSNRISGRPDDPALGLETGFGPTGDSIRTGIGRWTVETMPFWPKILVVKFLGIPYLWARLAPVRVRG